MIKQRAFSLIELIAVIALFSILMAVALPIYINIKREATRNQLANIRGNLDSLSQLVWAKAKTQAVVNGSLVINGRTIAIVDGYPEPHWNNAFRYLLDISARNGFTPVNQVCRGYALCGVGNQRRLPGVGAVTGRVVMIWPEGYRLSEQCYVFYHHPENGNPPTTGEMLSGC
jgi:MSHA pilin protein MshA